MDKIEDKKKIKYTKNLKVPPYNLQNDGKYYNDTLKFNAHQGHGFAAEQANNLVDQYKGDKAVVLNENVKNGPDRIVNGVQIQTKYCKNAQTAVQNCFKDGKFKYSGQQIEVPPEQYDEVVRLFEKRGIKNAIIRKGHVSYKVAKNIAKFGTIEGLTYDVVTGINIGINAFGISALFSFAFTKWNGGSTEECVKNALQTSSQIFGMNVVSHVFSQQFARSSLNGFAHQSTLNVLQKVLTKDQFATFANSFRDEGAKKIYGAAAQQNVAKMVKGQAVFAAGILVLQTGWDVISVTRGKISGKQLAKNFFSNLGSAGGGLACAVYGTCIAGPVGGLIGGIVGGIISQFAVKKVLDQITPDDLDEMAEILNNQIIKLQKEEYLLTEQEFNEVLNKIKSQINKDFLQNMFESSDRQQYAKKKLKDYFQQALKNRPKVKVNEEINNYFKNEG
ncbi:tetratricopeptide repeat protein (macronuclear) [Tetrahymena thermophila SB210]|uniref:Tetratricopeptide repeat protein n=1 Tax=Tetrahymena thermophila (strain SB210) TaxID=312017 RepID=I7M2I8_TETTS|nr:tetratricopeptide repeat protein [Tetrahymena thermophila SB210]EAS00537.1 tetratricopeptide repeat protein [Tetrahymena thermophila SB210]|eukprot:XP_001020782.1 tetratricopeptide repeat protein [Tetrahymena thermophila SB210]